MKYESRKIFDFIQSATCRQVFMFFTAKLSLLKNNYLRHTIQISSVRNVFYRRNHQKCSIKKVFLKKKKPSTKVFSCEFCKICIYKHLIAQLHVTTYETIEFCMQKKKKSLQQRYFPVNFAKFLFTSTLLHNSMWLIMKQ